MSASLAQRLKLPVRQVNDTLLAVVVRARHGARIVACETINTRATKDTSSSVLKLTLDTGEALALRRFRPRALARTEYRRQMRRTADLPEAISPLWYSAPLGIVAAPWFEGPPLLRDNMRRNLSEVCEPALTWLFKLHASAPQSYVQLDQTPEFARLRGIFTKDEIPGTGAPEPKADPALCALGLELLDGLESAHRRVPLTTRHGPWHGDFHPQNVLTDGRALRIIDFAPQPEGPQMADLARFLTHTTLRGLMHKKNIWSLRQDMLNLAPPFSPHDLTTLYRAEALSWAQLMSWTVANNPGEMRRVQALMRHVPRVLAESGRFYPDEAL